jgi:hypothetical protein
MKPTLIKRRFEILLPTRYNDGRSIILQEMHTLQQTLHEVVEHFGAMSYSPNSILGVWIHDGKRFDDELFQLTVDVEDTPENSEFFVAFKKRLLERFQQLDLYIVSYKIDVL